MNNGLKNSPLAGLFPIKKKTRVKAVAWLDIQVLYGFQGSHTGFKKRSRQG